MKKVVMFVVLLIVALVLSGCELLFICQDAPKEDKMTNLCFANSTQKTVCKDLDQQGL